MALPILSGPPDGGVAQQGGKERSYGFRVEVGLRLAWKGRLSLWLVRPSDHRPTGKQTTMPGVITSAKWIGNANPKKHVEVLGVGLKPNAQDVDV